MRLRRAARRQDGEDEDELPEADCATVPTVLDEPVASWVEAQPNPELDFRYEAAVMPGGDLVWIAGNERWFAGNPTARRFAFGHDGELAWDYYFRFDDSNHHVRRRGRDRRTATAR